VEQHAVKPASVISEDGWGAKGGTSGCSALRATGGGVTARSEQPNRQEAATDV